MKIFLFLNLLFLLISIRVIDPQVRRIVLLEEATNTSCSYCALNNPKLQAFFKSYFGGVISVRNHAWWPGENDPMYLLNPGENITRIQNYYRIFSVPNYYMDGFDYGEPVDPLAMIDQFHYDLYKNSPVKIKVTADIDADSVRATLKLIGVSPVYQTQLKFRAAIIERMVQYSSPPGSNGETIFPDVFRKMLPDTNGYAIDNISPGEEITYYVSYPVNPEWNWQDLAVVAWLQTDESPLIPPWPHTINYEIIQSNISIPTYIIQSDDPLGMFLSPEQNYLTTLKIINENYVDLHLRLKVTDAQVPGGWSYFLTYNNIGFDSVDVEISPGDSVVFSLSVSSNSNPGIISLAILAQNLDDLYNYGYTANFLGITKTENSNVLFIDDDGGSNSETAYFEAFDSVVAQYISIEKRFLPALKTQILAENFKAVFWNITQGAQRFSWLEIDFLEHYLNNGGNLFIAVSYPEFFRTFAGWVFTVWNYEVLDFCHNYLDAEFYEYFAYNSPIEGIAGTLGSGITTDLDGSSQVAIGSYSGVSDTIFLYTGTENYGGLSYDAGTYKTIFLGAGLEQFTSDSARQLFTQRVVSWFAIPVGVSNEKINIPDQYSLEQNYPNPFNPLTQIRYALPQTSQVIIKVYDVLGNEIITLVNEEKPAGSYELTWNASQLSSGVYFSQLRAGTYVSVKKMILLK